MAFEDAEVRQFVTWRILPIVVIAGTISYYRKKGWTLKNMKRKINAFAIVKVMNRMNKRKEIASNKNKLFEKLKTQVPSYKRLDILEIGVGGGSNFSLYPPDSRVICLDPNPNFESYLIDNARKNDIEVKRFVRGFAEDLGEVEDCSVDAVVSTFVLCSLRDTQKALTEIKRVLKPNGTFYFIEHIADQRGTILNRIQRLLNPIWYFITGDCQLKKETGRDIDRAGFSSTSINYFYIKGLLLYLVKPMMWGTATK